MGIKRILCEQNWRSSRKLVLVVVLVALFLDAVLMTVILPIVPDMISKMQTIESGASDDENERNSTMSDNSTISDDSTENDVSTRVGILFASKAFIQVFVGPFVGVITNKVGYTKPMFTGFLIMFLSTLTYAFAESYWTMLIARAIQGVGSSFTSISGLAMLAQWYPDDEERGSAMSVAFAGTGLGAIVGPVFGGFFYQYFGKSVPFLILAFFALFDGGLRLLVVDRLSDARKKTEATPLFTLLKDPYILLAVGTIFLANTGIAILEPLLPIHMMKTMQATSLEQGLSFLPLSITFMLGLNIFGRVTYWMGRYLAAILGLILMSCCLIVIPLASTSIQLILPNAGYGLSVSLVESAMLPFMAHLVDIRHSSVYGNVYAITDTAFCLAFFVGPTVGGALMSDVGFGWTLGITAFLCFSYAPFLILLRDPPLKEEQQELLTENSASTLVSISDHSASVM